MELSVELKDLVGAHSLDAVDMSNEQVKTWGDHFEDAEVLRFRLDGKLYTAVEDPGDGYRSSMKDITVGEGSIKNVFKPVAVVGVHRTKSQHYGCDMLELIEVKSGRTVLEVGTENSDDCYPMWVANFRPENITQEG